MTKIPAYIIGEKIKEFYLRIDNMTEDEIKIIKAGSLINFNKNKIR